MYEQSRFRDLDCSASRGCLDRRDAASYIACSTRLLDNLAAAGDIPRIKIGRKTVFRVADLDAYIESKVQRSEVVQ